MSAHVLLKLGKTDKIQGLPSICFIAILQQV